MSIFHSPDHTHCHSLFFSGSADRHLDIGSMINFTFLSFSGDSLRFDAVIQQWGWVRSSSSVQPRRRVLSPEAEARNWSDGLSGPRDSVCPESQTFVIKVGTSQMRNYNDSLMMMSSAWCSEVTWEPAHSASSGGGDSRDALAFPPEPWCTAEMTTRRHLRSFSSSSSFHHLRPHRTNMTVSTWVLPRPRSIWTPRHETLRERIKEWNNNKKMKPFHLELIFCFFSNPQL